MQDFANIIVKGKVVRARVPVPTIAEGGMRRLLVQLHYEGIEKPDYEVLRDWSKTPTPETPLG